MQTNKVEHGERARYYRALLGANFFFAFSLPNKHAGTTGVPLKFDVQLAWQPRSFPTRHPRINIRLPSAVLRRLGIARSRVCVFSSHSFWTSSSLDVPAGVTQEEGQTGFFIHLLSAVRALIFFARRIQPFLSLVDREVEFCVLTI